MLQKVMSNNGLVVTSVKQAHNGSALCSEPQEYHDCPAQHGVARHFARAAHAFSLPVQSSFVGGPSPYGDWRAQPLRLRL